MHYRIHISHKNLHWTILSFKKPPKYCCVCLTQDSPLPEANLKLKPIQLVCATIHSFMWHSMNFLKYLIKTSCSTKLFRLSTSRASKMHCHTYFSMIPAIYKANEWASSNRNKTNKLTMTGQAVQKMRLRTSAIYLQLRKSKTFRVLSLEWILGVLTLFTKMDSCDMFGFTMWTNNCGHIYV